MRKGPNPSIFADRNEKFPFLTMQSVRRMVDSSLPKTGKILIKLAYNQKAYSEAHRSAWGKKTNGIITYWENLANFKVS
jgi:hypothetical protein